MPEAHGLTLFCDDIRLEHGGKVSYMGIYGQDMRVAGPKPALLPKMSFAVHLQIPSRIEKAKVKVVVRREMNEVPTVDLVGVEANLERPPAMPVEEDAWTFMAFHLSAVPFQVDDDCRLAVRAYIDDVEIKLGTLPVLFVNPPAN